MPKRKSPHVISERVRKRLQRQAIRNLDPAQMHAILSQSQAFRAEYSLVLANYHATQEVLANLRAVTEMYARNRLTIYMKHKGRVVGFGDVANVRSGGADFIVKYHQSGRIMTTTCLFYKADTAHPHLKSRGGIISMGTRHHLAAVAGSEIMLRKYLGTDCANLAILFLLTRPRLHFQTAKQNL